MSSIVNRKGVWQARYTDSNGKQHRASTSIKVKGGDGLTAKEAKKAAQAIADGMEASARGVAAQRIVESVQAHLESAGIARTISPEAWFSEFANTPEFQQVKPQQQKQYKHVGEAFCQWLGKRSSEPISKIKSSDIVSFLRYEADALHYAKATLGRHLSALSVMFNSAEHRNIVSKNPARTIRSAMLPVKRVKEEIMPFTRQQIATLKEKLPVPLKRLMLVCLYTMGQRMADCCRMKWSMFNFKEDSLTFTTGKTKRCMYMPISPEFKKLLLVMKQEQEQLGLDTEFLFPEWGKRKTFNQISVDFRKQLIKLNMISPVEKMDSPAKCRPRHRHPLCFHSLRHFVVSELSAQRQFSPDLIRESVGHSTEAARLCYVSFAYEQKKAVMQYIGEVVNG